MFCNLGDMERVFRIMLGLVLLTTAFFAEMPTWAAAVAYVMGTYVPVSGVVGFCPAWKIFGINTVAKDRSVANK